ncbi:MAG: nicotinate phosphoribosyltransferase [Nitrospirae bacterium]|nr:nicotinate phosphoribosyltransferase [Nitrospirota bacterium]
MKPINDLVNPLLTDLYQLTMIYTYWKNGRAGDSAAFDLFFRKNPFGGEFAIFAGLGEVLCFVESFAFTDEQISYVRSLMPQSEPEFFQWLRKLDCSQLRIDAIREGTVVFPRVPLIRVEGPLCVAQIIETTLLNLVNYPTLVATNAARFRMAAGFDKVLLEFGLRRAQGPDGAISASRYCYMGGFDATSNVLAGRLFGIPVRGTHAHSFVLSYRGLSDLRERMIKDTTGHTVDFVEKVLHMRTTLGGNSNEEELAAFIAYAQAFPENFLALVDTYDTLSSGVPNFICVATVLKSLGYEPVGIRLDSGDLSYLSKRARRMFADSGEKTGYDISGCLITASNEIDEDVLMSLHKEGHEVDVFGIGTHLVTCSAQPALGAVYKLVEIDGEPRIKLTQDIEKVTIPGRKDAYRLYGSDGRAILDLLVQHGDAPPVTGKRVLCRHPFNALKRVYVTPAAVVPLYATVWESGRGPDEPVTLQKTRQYVLEQLNDIRADHLRLNNPTPYKVSLSDTLYGYVHDLWEKEATIAELG